MLRYIGRRLLQTIPVFFGATFLIFAMVYLMPGDPVAALGGDKGLTEAAAARIREEYNLENSLKDTRSMRVGWKSTDFHPTPHPLKYLAGKNYFQFLVIAKYCTFEFQVN